MRRSNMELTLGPSTSDFVQPSSLLISLLIPNLAMLLLMRNAAAISFDSWEVCNYDGVCGNKNLTDLTGFNFSSHLLAL